MSEPSAAYPAVEAVLFSEEQIRARVRALAEEVAGACGDRPLALVGILRGSFMFLADLVRELYRHDVAARIDFMTLESYGAGTVSCGTVRLAHDLALDVRGASVVLVDDILDTGRTLDFARRHLLARRAAAVHSCVLLDKPSRRVVPFQADFVGFEVPGVFVVGYGLDCDGHYRQLPYLARLAAP